MLKNYRSTCMGAAAAYLLNAAGASPPLCNALPFFQVLNNIGSLRV